MGIQKIEKHFSRYECEKPHPLRVSLTQLPVLIRLQPEASRTVTVWQNRHWWRLLSVIFQQGAMAFVFPKLMPTTIYYRKGEIGSLDALRQPSKNHQKMFALSNRNGRLSLGSLAWDPKANTSVWVTSWRAVMLLNPFRDLKISGTGKSSSKRSKEQSRIPLPYVCTWGHQNPGLSTWSGLALVFGHPMTSTAMRWKDPLWGVNYSDFKGHFLVTILFPR